MSKVTETPKELPPFKEVCDRCFQMVPGKQARKCALSGKTRLGCMTACQYLDKRGQGESPPA